MSLNNRREQDALEEIESLGRRAEAGEMSMEDAEHRMSEIMDGMKAHRDAESQRLRAQSRKKLVVQLVFWLVAAAIAAAALYRQLPG